jgi:hypothetical protein
MIKEKKERVLPLSPSKNCSYIATSCEGSDTEAGYADEIIRPYPGLLLAC